MLTRWIGVAAILLTVAFMGEARAAQLCAWIVETNEENDVHKLKLLLSTDKEVEFLYKIGGQGIVDGSGHSHSPSSGTFFLRDGQTDSPWSFGATLTAPGKIDVTVEIHQKPADIFDEKPTPLLAKFTFQRAVPESEKKAPPVFAKKQCATVK
jgi:hypothetical protein